MANPAGFVCGDTTGSPAAHQYVVAALASRLPPANTDFAVDVGDNVYDAAWYSEIDSYWDAANRNSNGPSYSLYNDKLVLIMGNHDLANPISSINNGAGGNNISKWKASTTLASEWVGLGRVCIPLTVAKRKGFYFEAITDPALNTPTATPTGTTGAVEPNWPTTIGSVIQDGSVFWKCVWPGADMWTYINQKLSGGVYAPYIGQDRIQKTRRATSPPMATMQGIHPEGWGIWNINTVDPNNPHNEYGYKTIAGSDASGTFQWHFIYLNTELEYAQRPGDTHTARGIGPNIDAGISTASKQYKWLQALFQSLPANDPKIVFLHWPWFWVEGERTSVQDVYQLCIANNTKAIFAGHQHNYVRFQPIDSTGTVKLPVGGIMQAGTCVPFICGMGGNDVSGPLVTGGTYYNRVENRPTTGTLVNAGFPKACTGEHFGAVHLVLRRSGFDITMVVGATQIGTATTATKVTYPAASNGSIFDIASYDFATAPLPKTPTTTQTYIPDTADLGHPIRSKVRAHNASGVSTWTPSAWSDPVAATISTAPTNITPPVISGTPNDGEVLTLSDYGTWDLPVDTYTIQWQRGLPGQTLSDIVGANQPTYTVGPADVGFNIALRLSATNAIGSGQAFTNTIGPVSRTAPTNVDPPNMTGLMIVGETLVCSTGSWEGTQPITFSFQWQNGTGAPDPNDATQVIITWSDIVGATNPTYSIGLGDVGKYIRCRVGASNGA